MGTDIHGVVQVRWPKAEAWRDEGEIHDDRNYAWFSVLAGVRHAFDEELEPIQERRGFPDGFPVSDEYHDPRRDSGMVWMGDHSHGWATLDEIEAWPHWDKPVKFYGETTTPREAVGEAVRLWLKYLRAAHPSKEVRIVFGFGSCSGSTRERAPALPQQPSRHDAGQRLRQGGQMKWSAERSGASVMLLCWIESRDKYVAVQIPDTITLEESPNEFMALMRKVVEGVQREDGTLPRYVDEPLA